MRSIEKRSIEKRSAEIKTDSRDKNRWRAIGLLTAVCMLATLFTGLLVNPIQVTAAAEYDDGVYTISGTLRHATADQNSMGNAAIVWPMQVYIENGKATLHIELQALTASLGSTKFTGYLAALGYFSDWEGGTSGYDVPDGKIAEPATVISYYIDTYDSYNDPDTGTDSQVRGQLYPQLLSLPVTAGDAEVWTQVYVPVMEAISAGSGTQYARLQLDWSTLTFASDLPTDTEEETQTAVVDKNGLYMLLLSADSLVSRDQLYTSATLKALKKVITAAKKVYSDSTATQSQVDAKLKKLSEAIVALKEKEGKTDTEPDGNTESALDMTALADGTYYLSGSMQKTDKKTDSMANEAINHRITLVVKDGKYTLQLEFAGLTISGQQGYLGTLSYFTTGYTLDQYGVPQGATKKVEVLTYQEASDGSRFADALGTDYPKTVSFSMIEEAKKDGYVPLQVFVPIMDSIAAGSGTQPVYLKLDLSSLTADKETVQEESDSTQPAETVTVTDPTPSVAVGAATMTNAQLTASAALPKSGVNDSGKESSNSLTLTSSLEGQVSVVQEPTDAQTATGSVAVQTAQAEAPESTAAEPGAAIPVVVSVLSVLAGLFYKFKVRG